MQKRLERKDMSPKIDYWLSVDMHHVSDVVFVI